jgi:phosphatidylinositol alpha-1,6-mannosyltransferase
MVFLEAGACAKPCIAGREGGQAEAVVDGQTGLVVDGTNQQAVTAALERLLGDATLRQTLGKAGRKNALRFDWPAVVQKTVELVENIQH